MEKIYCARPGYRPDLFAFGIGYDNSSVGISGVEGLYNGNISETHWRSGSDNALRSYGYRYDALNRLTDAFYKRESLVTNGYNEHISYDPNGNITMLQRFGGLDEQNISLEIDNLGYRYGAGSNKLLAVNDASGSPEGFSDGTNSGDDFAYDASGNMISDKNKNITSIAYNHLNLPVRIVFGGDLNTRVDYAYDALGAKLQKTVVQYNPVGDHSIVLTSVTDYLGFQYKDGVLQFFPTSEGYVSHTKGSYSYVYNYTDHLGNVRMSYAKNPASPSELKIIEESHYYPFGLKHQNYNSEEFLFEKKDSNLQLRAPVVKEVLPFQYKYNAKEWQYELALNWYDYGARNYDPAIGRWMNIDPLAEKMRRWSPYNYAFDNPMRFIDPDGMGPNDVIVGQKYQAQFNKALTSVFGSEATNFQYDSSGKLSFTGDTKNFNSDQKAVFKGLDKLMTSSEVTNVVYEQQYTITDNSGNSMQIDASKSGGESTALKAENPISENYVVVDPSGPTSIGVQEVTSNYYSSKGKMPSLGDPPNFKPATVQTNPESLTFHGLGHVINAGKAQDKVLDYDNKARNQMGLSKRNDDETHNSTVTAGTGAVWEKK